MSKMTTSPAMPSAWIDRLFERLAAMYGKAWFDCWADVPMADVKDAWRTILGKFEADAIRRGLESCSTECKFPPSAPEFAGLCIAPVKQTHQLYLAGPKAVIDPDVLKSVRAIVTCMGKAGDKREWARKILARKEAGEHVEWIAEKYAREALGMIEDEPA